MRHFLSDGISLCNDFDIARTVVVYRGVARRSPDFWRIWPTSTSIQFTSHYTLSLRNRFVPDINRFSSVVSLPRRASLKRRSEIESLTTPAMDIVLDALCFRVCCVLIYDRIYGRFLSTAESYNVRICQNAE